MQFWTRIVHKNTLWGEYFPLSTFSVYSVFSFSFQLAFLFPSFHPRGLKIGEVHEVSSRKPSHSRRSQFFTGMSKRQWFPLESNQVCANG